MSEIVEQDERFLQRGVHRLLSDPSRLWRSENGRQFQVLSPGRINRHEGPDFLAIALFIGGEVLIGNAEFHREASDWHSHNHSDDPRYTNVILHVITRNNAVAPEGAETLLLTAEEIESVSAVAPDHLQDDGMELQHFALLRILRRTAECSALLKQFKSDKAFAEHTRTFLLSIAKKRRRPIHSADDLSRLADKIQNTFMAQLIVRASNTETLSFFDEMSKALKTKIDYEGDKLRHEIAVNCFLPMMLSVANEMLRAQIFLWYWSVRASNEYGMLKRRFPTLSQQYFWQQQGMLEYIREHGERGENIAAESIASYNFADALHFYKQAAAPVADNVILLADFSEYSDEIDFIK